MTYFTSATSNQPKPTPKLHLFWVCEPKKQEAFNKLKATYPTASILWKKEL